MRAVIYLCQSLLFFSGLKAGGLARVYSFCVFLRSTPALSPPQAFSVSEELLATLAQGQQWVVLERNGTW